ncbi:hypothetical protein OQA88_9859 [Cercophora sp. LCS_1]
MNAAQGQPQGGGAHPPGVQNLMYRPEMMRNIKLLTEEERTKYERGLAQLWKTHDSYAQGTIENTEAKKKITDFGRMLVGKIQQRKMQQAQQAQQAQQGQQAVQPNQASQQVQGQPKPSTAPNANQEGAASAVASTTAASATARMNTAGPQQKPIQLPAHIQNHLNEFKLQAPATIPDTDKEKWVAETRNKYARALMQMETAKITLTRFDQMVKDRQQNAASAPMTADEEKAYTERRAGYLKQYNDANQFAATIRKNYAAPAGAQKQVANDAAAAQGSTAQTGNQMRPQAPVRQPAGQPGMAMPPAAQGVAGGPMQQSTATVNAAIEAAKNQQLAAGRMAGTNPLANKGPQNQGIANSQAQASPTMQQPLATHPPVSQPPHHAQVKIEPGTQPQQQTNISAPLPINTALAAGIGGNGLQQAAGTPTQASARVQTPQSATPTNTGIRPLTHAAAISMAQQPRPGSLSGPPGTTPGSAPGIAGAAQPGHSHAHPAAQTAGQTIQSKMPIPKVLPEKATQIPTSVAPVGGVGNGRPTYSSGTGIAGGVMGQPALAKTPAYQMEGEGERVLNKKKLDELVRQVCGGTAEGQEGSMLTPDVEETVLNLADHFVDDVLHAACRIAKERGSKVLEIRDIQLVLERTYNIRIPGYSSDELRTVRKVQPNAQWITKMSAVQAAKVMPGKGDL